ncbi:hypothetical protein NVS55_28430 [Myxococcus stipitatus]|uniref:hypothetical protein n=1 Tax=Myxococcus stipitatus TaxID=83455 RepID=UPI003144F564
MLSQPFLTQLDSRAAIKGSRDPLGVQSLWSRLGRHVVANLTTVSTSVRDFTVLLLGHYFVERVADAGGSEGDLATFLKWEQLAAYARTLVNEDRSYRGTERVARRLAEGERIHLGTDSGAQILGNQRIYGLWGLYTVPARASRLLEGEPTRLTPDARDAVERHLLPLLEQQGARTVSGIIDRLRAPRHPLDYREHSRDAPILKGIGAILKKVRAGERQLYREHLLHGGPADLDASRGTRGQQRLFAELLTETLEDEDWVLTPKSLEALSHRAMKRGELGEQLAASLDRIRTMELLFAPAVALFEHLLGCHEQAPSAIASSVRKHWGTAPRGTLNLEAIRKLEPELRTPGDDDSSQRWLRLAESLHASQYEEALHQLMSQNEAVMKARGAAAWTTLKNGKLHVRLRDEHLGRLPDAKALPSYWRHAYFIEALRNVAADLRGTP